MQRSGRRRSWLSTRVAGVGVLKPQVGIVSQLPSAQAKTLGGSAHQRSASRPNLRRTESSQRDEPRSQVQAGHAWPQGPLPGPQARPQAPPQ